MYRNIHELRDLNRILNKWESYFQKVVLSSRPIFVQLPTGTKCNLKCSFCTDREGEAIDSYKNLSFQEFLPLSGPLSLASLVQLYGWGEPFVNPDYEKVFDYVTGNYPGIQVYISTNGVLMKERWVKKLVSYGNVIVNVSLNAATPETYSQVMRADRFQEVLENIRNLDQARKKSKFDLMLLLSFVALKQNIEELPKFVELASDLGAGVMVQDLNVLVDRHKDLSLDLYPEPGRVSEIFKLARLKAAERNVSISSFGADYVDNSALCDNLLIGSGEEQGAGELIHLPICIPWLGFAMSPGRE